MAYTYPGVYIEEVPSGVRPIENAGTSTAAFIGTTEKGTPGVPSLIFKWADYVEQFGGFREVKKVTGTGDAAVTEYKPDAMGLAVYTFFLNGGGAAYIVSTDVVPSGTVAPGTSGAINAAIFDSLSKIRDINIICLPGKTWGTHVNAADKGDEAVIGLAISHAEKMKNRMVIVDLAEATKLSTESGVNKLSLSTNEFAVTYYPWLEVANPFYKTEDQRPDKEYDAKQPPTFTIAPSSFAAGMWAKIDGRRGVWKAPAGVETALLGVAGVADDVDNNQQGQLNHMGINCIRKLPGFGPVIWGSRTLATKADPEWRYVPVRRTACMIEESIYNNIQWAVFEPNDHRLWSSLRVNIDAFMNGLWRAGAFQGERSGDAYFVRCNLGDTMTQADIDTGKVIVEVGFAPLKPAEFVIIRIQQKVAQQ